jgi:hypothetical protein
VGSIFSSAVLTPQTALRSGEENIDPLATRRETSSLGREVTRVGVEALGRFGGLWGL